MPIAAHHGFDTEYDAKKKVSLTGVVTKVEWTNPHMHVYIDVTDASGKGHQLEPRNGEPEHRPAPGVGTHDAAAG